MCKNGIEHYRVFIYIVVLKIVISVTVSNAAVGTEGQQQQQLLEDSSSYAEIIELHGGLFVAEYTWYIDDIFSKISLAELSKGQDRSNILLSNEFYLGKPGYKARLSLSPYRNNTKDGNSYLGLWFTLVPGRYDDLLEWPFQHTFNLTLLDQSVDHSESYDGVTKDVDITINPLTSICRLLEQFTRPYGPKAGEDGCGKAYFISHSQLFHPEASYIIEDTVAIRLSVVLNIRGKHPKRAQVKMRGQELVSEFFWKITDIEQRINEVGISESKSIKSDLFYVNSESYLMVLHLLINARQQQIGLYATIMPGDYDNQLEWPFPYTYEMSIVDQSPGYFTSDRKGLVNPATGSCPLSSFTRPNLSPAAPCGFRKMMGFKKLHTRNYKKNGDMIVKFTVILDKLPKYGSISINNGYLVSEYIWSIPHIDRKIELGKSGKLTNLLSDRFYTSSQGYLIQLQLRFQKSKRGHIGLFVSILEGEHDNLVGWPFKKKFSLSIVDQQSNGTRRDATIIVDPQESDVIRNACRGSFWRPFGRNDGCGSSNMVTYETLDTRRYIRYGALLVKVRFYLEPVLPPKVAISTVRDGHLVAQYSWMVDGIHEKIRAADNGNVEFYDSERFYVTSDGYRMIIRLYPSKDNYLGLYAAMVKGKNDDKLSWPFSYKYQLSIVVGQGSRKNGKNIVHATYPSSMSHDGCPRAAFDRPKKEIAEWSCGEGRLVSHISLLSSDFIKDDKILVRLTVFLKEYLPRVASMNFRNYALTSEYSWILENADTELEMMRLGEKRRLESPVFYTTNQGYAVKLYLVVGGHSFDTVGLYFTISKGRYDAALDWPFGKTVNVTVVDQRNSGRDVTKTIDPMKTKCPKQTFHKPNDLHKNRLCGFPTVLPLIDLESFVKDKILIIRASIVLGTFA